MKKFLCGLMVMAGCMLCGSLSVFASDITVKVANSQIEFDQPPVVVQGRTLVPFRAIFEALGAEVEWDAENRAVTGVRGDKVVSMIIDVPEMQINEKIIKLDVPAQIVNSRTMVPVRAVSDGLDETVTWNANTKTIDIKTSLLYENQTLKEYINPNWTEEIGLSISGSNIGEGDLTFDSYVWDYVFDKNGKEQPLLSDEIVSMNTSITEIKKGNEAKEVGRMQGAIDVDKFEEKLKDIFGEVEWSVIDCSMYSITDAPASWFNTFCDKNLDACKASTGESEHISDDTAVLCETNICYDGNVYTIAYSKQNLFDEGRTVYVFCLPKDYSDLILVHTACAEYINSDAEAIKYVAGEGEQVGYMSRGLVCYPFK